MAWCRRRSCQVSHYRRLRSVHDHAVSLAPGQPAGGGGTSPRSIICAQLSTRVRGTAAERQRAITQTRLRPPTIAPHGSSVLDARSYWSDESVARGTDPSCCYRAAHHPDVLSLTRVQRCCLFASTCRHLESAPGSPGRDPLRCLCCRLLRAQHRLWV